MNSSAHRSGKKNHQGRNLKRFRGMFGIKQEALAVELGEEWSQKRVSLLEARARLDPDALTRVAEILKVPEQAIRNFDEEAAIGYFNTFNDPDAGKNLQETAVNPLGMLIEAFEENKKLYERLLESEREKTEILKNLLNHRSQ